MIFHDEDAERTRAMSEITAEQRTTLEAAKDKLAWLTAQGWHYTLAGRCLMLWRDRQVEGRYYSLNSLKTGTVEDLMEFCRV